jgi:hypothetical protein
MEFISPKDHPLSLDKTLVELVGEVLYELRQEHKLVSGTEYDNSLYFTGTHGGRSIYYEYLATIFEPLFIKAFAGAGYNPRFDLKFTSDQDLELAICVYTDYGLHHPIGDLFAGKESKLPARYPIGTLVPFPVANQVKVYGGIKPALSCALTSTPLNELVPTFHEKYLESIEPLVERVKRIETFVGSFSDKDREDFGGCLNELFFNQDMDHHEGVPFGVEVSNLTNPGWYMTLRAAMLHVESESKRGGVA